MRVVIAGGGTGGHLYPGIGLAQEFRRQEEGAEILFVGRAGGMDERLLNREGLRFQGLRVEGVVGKRGRGKTLLMLPGALWGALRILTRFKPGCVIGMGGYASGPLLVAATLVGIRRVILEPNVIPGVTNRILAPFVDYVVVAFEETEKYMRSSHLLVLGNPVRREILEGGGYCDTRTLLVFGGSQGAHSINRAMVEALEYLREKKIFIIHQTGEKDFEWVQEVYLKRGYPARVEPYIYDMAPALRQADLVVSRAGATTVAELTACGRPALLIPFPHASHNHQEANAALLERTGAAVVLRDEGLTGRLLAGTVLGLMEDFPRRREMAERSLGLGKREAAYNIVRVCRELVQKGS